MVRKSINVKEIPIGWRILAFAIGIAGLVFIAVYSIRWEDLPFPITISGINITVYAIATFFVLSGIAFATFVKSSFLGEWRLD